MSSPSLRRTFKSPQKIKTKSLVKVFKVKEIKSDTEFLNLFEKSLKTEKFISESARKAEKGKFENTSTEPIRDNSKSKNFETEPIKDKAPHNLPTIIEMLKTSSNPVPETIQNNNSCGNIIPTIEVLNTSSDSGFETETEEPILACNKNCLLKITDVHSLGKNKVKLVKVF